MIGHTEVISYLMHAPEPINERADRHGARTFAWLNRFRRLTIRYERNADLHLAFLNLACAMIAFKSLQKGFC